MKTDLVFRIDVIHELILWTLPYKKLLHIIEIIMKNRPDASEHQTPHSGKVENDVNKQGHQDTTQINQGRRTPLSRSDRETHIGGRNQSQSRRGSVDRT